MMDAIGQRAVSIVGDVLRDHGIWDATHAATDVVSALQSAGLIARCSCPRGWGQVRDDKCPAHGSRTPAHTVTGAT